MIEKDRIISVYVNRSFSDHLLARGRSRLSSCLSVVPSYCRPVPIVTKLIKITDSWGHVCPKGVMLAKIARMP